MARSAVPTTIVGLARGINVGRAAAVSMADLAAAFESAGFSDVKTILRSGNVIATSAGPVGSERSARIEQEVHARSGVDSRILLIDAKRFAAICDANPLLELSTDDSRLLVTFLGERTDPTTITIDAEAIAPEVVSVHPDAVYQWCPLGISESRLTARFWRQFGPAVTGRNWRTTQRIIAELHRRNP